MPRVDVPTVPEEIVDEDRSLSSEVRYANGSVKAARERRAEALAALNQYRWEMTVCEHGPQFPQEEYGRAVGNNQSTISRGADAWQATLDASESMHDASNRCSFGGASHHQPDAATPPTVTPPTPSQVETHAEARRVVDAGEIKAAAITMLAAHFGLAPTTVEVNYRPLVNEATRRVRERHDVDNMTIGEVEPLLNNIALELRQEDRLRRRREGDVARWMKSNRASDNPVPIAEVRRMMTRIERRMEAQSLSWAEAEAESREWDHRRCEADRIANDLARAARLAVIALTEATVDMERAALRLGQALRSIEADSVPLSDDERELANDRLVRAAAIIRQAMAALTGDSGTDWDAAMEALTRDTEGDRT